MAGASGGAGAASSLTNAASGRTNGGALGLYQFATGGAGGYSSGGAAGAGGAASSYLTFDDVTANPTHAASMKGKVLATGGIGGAGTNGGSNGAYGGAAVADLTLTGAQALTAKTKALGGDAGGGSGSLDRRRRFPGPISSVVSGSSALPLPRRPMAGPARSVSPMRLTPRPRRSRPRRACSRSASPLEHIARRRPTGHKRQGDRRRHRQWRRRRQSERQDEGFVIGQAALAFSAGGQALAMAPGAPDAASTTAVLNAANPTIKDRLWRLSASVLHHRRAGRRLCQERVGTTSETTTDLRSI